MIHFAADLRSRGHTPDLPTLFRAATQGDPRYNGQAQRAQQDAQTARARAANVQVTGTGNSAGSVNASVEIDDILSEII